jgi:BNR repeat-like domain
MKLIDNGNVFSGIACTATANCCFPAIVLLADGSLMCSWRAGTTKESPDGKIWLARSNSGGSKWDKWPLTLSDTFDGTPGEFHYGPLTEFDDGRLLIALMWTDRSRPLLPFFNPKTEGLLPLRTIFAESTDGGHTWAQTRAMDRAPYHSPMPITGAVIKLSDGRIGCHFEVNKDYYDESPWRHAAAMKISSDGGQTWPEAIEIANDPTNRFMYWDQRHSALGNQHVATFWTYDRKKNSDANIHISHSADDGRTWTLPQDTGITGQVAHPVLLKDQRLAVVFVDRFKSRSILARLSVDGGKSFGSDELVIYTQPGAASDPGNGSDSAAYLQDMRLWTFGRIDALTDSTGDIWIVYYAGCQDATNIHWARIRL